MRTILLAAAAVYALAWYRGWGLADLNVPAFVSDRAGCDASYPDVCISPPPPSLACSDISVAGFKVFGDDPHAFDPDRDGIGCN